MYAFFLTLLASSRVQFKYIDGKYLVIEGDQKHYFLKERGGRYVNGLESCGNKIAKSYGIEKIVIQKSDLIVDVGANNGDLLLYLNAFSDCKYIGFEPASMDFKNLELNRNSSEVYNMAALDKSCEVLFYASSREADSSIYEPISFAESSIVKAVRLDEFLDSNIKIKILKVDAEGAEMEVIRGAEKILNQIEYIAIDLGFEKGINQETTAPQVINFLLANNFCILNFTRRNCFLFQNFKSFDI